MYLNKEITTIFVFTLKDFKLEDYNPHPFIKGVAAI